MRRFGKWLGRGLIALIGFGSLAYFLGPYEPVEADVRFDDQAFEDGVDAYFERIESAYGDITEGVRKRVIWAGEPGARTALSVLYIHGFSATSEEIRPVPDNVAEALGANLVFTRLTGHGRGGAAMAEASAGDWIRDTAEALAAAKAVGDEVIVITVSTGGTLAALAMQDAVQRAGVKGLVFISPNFGVNDPVAPLLTMPGARYILPLVAGKEHAWNAANELQARFWTTRYPTVAVFPMAALVKETLSRDYSRVAVPALFHYALEDTVVDASKTQSFIEGWGGPVQAEILPPEIEAGESRHVIAGDILVPDRSGPVSEMIISWARGL